MNTQTSSGGLRLALAVSLTYGAIFTVYGLQLPYLAVLLESRGLSPQDIGLAVAVPAMLRLFVNPVIAAWADANGSHGRLLVMLCCVGVAGAALLAPAQGLVVLALAITLLMVPLQSAMPFVEVLAMRGVRTFGLDYGKLRLWGSLTFIIATVGGGAMLQRAGAEALVPMLFVATILCVGASIVLLRASAGLNASQPSPRRASVGALRPSDILAQIRFVVAIPGLVAFLLGAAVIQASHAVYYAFSALHWTGQGISGEVVGALWALGVIAEIALFAVSSKVVKNLGATGLLALGGVAGSVRWAAMALDPALLWLWPLQLLHALSFGATHLAAIHFISERVPTQHAGMAQSLFATFAMGAIMALVLYASGFLYAAFDAGSYAAMAALALSGGLAAHGVARLTPDSRRTG